MATRAKKTSKPASKRSTSKKSANAAAKRATAKKSVSKKTTAKKAVPATKVEKVVTLDKLRKFNLFAAAVNAVFAVLSVVFLSKVSSDITLAHMTKDELASSATTVLGPAHEILANVQLRYMLAVIFGLSAVFSLLLATRLRNQYENGVKNKTSLLRWIFVGITSALLLEFSSIVGGVQDVKTLKLVAGLVVVTSLLGWVAEKQISAAGSKNFNVYWVSVVTGVLAWLPLVGSLIGTTLYGAERFSWYVYALAGVLLVGFISFATNLYRYIRDNGNAEDYLEFEGKYISTDFLIKLSAFAILVIALYK